MRWVAIVGGILIALLVLMLFVGRALPRTHLVTSHIRLAQPPDTVWAVVRNLGGVASWWPEVKRVERMESSDGKERWRETMGQDFAMTLVISEDEPPRRFKATIEDEPGAAFGGSWVYEVAPAPGGSEVWVHEEGWVGNPVFRVISRVMGYHRTMDSYLAALSRHFGESAVPDHVR